MKKQTVSNLKKKCWDLFSHIIRSRDCKNGWGNCVTCGARRQFSELQAGHFIPGRHNSVLFDLRNCHSQCYRCNCLLKGNLIEYYDFMLKTYGQETIEDLRRLDKINTQFKVFQLVEMYNQFKTIKKSL